MNLTELQAACETAISRWESGAADGTTPWVRLTVQRASPPRGDRLRLAGPGSPLGELLCCPSDGGYTCLFRAREVLAWLEKVSRG